MNFKRNYFFLFSCQTKQQRRGPAVGVLFGKIDKTIYLMDIMSGIESNSWTDITCKCVYRPENEK